MDLDFRNCKTAEDVKEVFAKEEDRMNHLKKILLDVYKEQDTEVAQNVPSTSEEIKKELDKDYDNNNN